MTEPVDAEQVPGRPPEGDPHHVLAPSGITDDRTRVLKHGDTFAVFDHLGQIKPGGLGEEGLYHDGTRYLSRLILELDGQPPFFLGSTVRDENDQLSVALTNPDRIRDRTGRDAARDGAPRRADVPLAGRVPLAGSGRGTTARTRSRRRSASASELTSRTSSRSAG